MSKNTYKSTVVNMDTNKLRIKFKEELVDESVKSNLICDKLYAFYDEDNNLFFRISDSFSFEDQSDEINKDFMIRYLSKIPINHIERIDATSGDIMVTSVLYTELPCNNSSDGQYNCFEIVEFICDKFDTNSLNPILKPYGMKLVLPDKYYPDAQITSNFILNEKTGFNRYFPNLYSIEATHQNSFSYPHIGPEERPTYIDFDNLHCIDLIIDTGKKTVCINQIIEDEGTHSLRGYSTYWDQKIIECRKHFSNLSDLLYCVSRINTFFSLNIDIEQLRHIKLSSDFSKAKYTILTMSVKIPRRYYMGSKPSMIDLMTKVFNFSFVRRHYHENERF